jgi:hypothetical protein
MAKKKKKQPVVPSTPIFYQAIGTLTGIFNITDTEQTVSVGGEAYNFLARPKTLEKLRSSETQTQTFRVYPKNNESGELVLSIVRLLKPDQKLSEEEEAQVFSLRGCWEIYNEFPCLVIHRNLDSNAKSRRRYLTELQTALTLDWQNAPSPDGQFWHLKALLKGGAFVVTQVLGLSEPPKKLEPFQSKWPKPVLKSDAPEEATAAKSENNTSDHEIAAKSKDNASEQEIAAKSKGRTSKKKTATKSEDNASEQETAAKSEDNASEQEIAAKSKGGASKKKAATKSKVPLSA